VNIRQIDVEQQKIGAASGEVQGLLTGGSFGYVEPGRAQDVGGGIERRRVVVDDDNAGWMICNPGLIIQHRAVLGPWLPSVPPPQTAIQTV